MAYTYPFKDADEKLKTSVWKKGKPIQGYDISLWCRDCYGATINYSDHGDINSKYGWEIDHIVPKAKGGSDDLINLQPLQWENNRKKGDS